MMKCANCPVKAGPSCWGEAHRPACGYVAAGRQEWVDHLVAMAEAPATPAPAADAPPLVPVARMLAILAAVRACPHRTAPACGCPSSPATCTRPDRAGAPAWPDDCRACVEPTLADAARGKSAESAGAADIFRGSTLGS